MAAGGLEWSGGVAVADRVIRGCELGRAERGCQRSVGEDGGEEGVLVEQTGDGWDGVGLGEDGVEVLFDGRGEAGGLDPFGAMEGLAGEGLVEAGLLEQMADAVGALVLEVADDVGGDADLEAVEAGLRGDGVEGVGDEVFAAAGGA